MHLPGTFYDDFIRCPRCAGPLDRSVDNGARCPACGFRIFFGPCVAVGAMALDGAGRLLLIRRARDPGRGKLGVPGGFIDAGETVEGALVREIREETGLECDRFEYLCSHPNLYRYGEMVYPVVDIFFLAWLGSIDRAQPNAEVAEFVVIPPGDVDPAEYAFDSMRAAHACLLTRLAEDGAV